MVLSFKYFISPIYPELGDNISFVFGHGLLAALIFNLPNTNDPDTYLLSIISE